MSFGELVVLIVVAIVVIGPKDLPKMLGKLGRFAGKMRRMAADLRYQSGIDEVLRTEGIQENLSEIRKLARGELDQITEATRMETARPFDPDPLPASASASASPTRAAAAASSASTASTGAAGSPAGSYNGGPIPYNADPYGNNGDFSGMAGARDREYPREGADDYGALPDTAFMYTQGFEPSALASDALYMTGDANGIVGPCPPPADPAAPPDAPPAEDAHDTASPSAAT